MYHCFFRRHVCLSNLKHTPSRELPLTARKTVFSHLKCESRTNYLFSHSWTVLFVRDEKYSVNGINHRFKNHGFRISTRSAQEARTGKIENGTETPLAPPRPLCVVGRLGRGKKISERGTMGKGKEPFPLPIVLCALFFDYYYFLVGGIPSGSLCGGERDCKYSFKHSSWTIYVARILALPFPSFSVPSNSNKETKGKAKLELWWMCFNI